MKQQAHFEISAETWNSVLGGPEMQVNDLNVNGGPFGHAVGEQLNCIHFLLLFQQVIVICRNKCLPIPSRMLQQ